MFRWPPALWGKVMLLYIIVILIRTILLIVIQL